MCLHRVPGQRESAFNAPADTLAGSSEAWASTANLAPAAEMTGVVSIAPGRVRHLWPWSRRKGKHERSFAA